MKNRREYYRADRKTRHDDNDVKRPQRQQNTTRKHWKERLGYLVEKQGLTAWRETETTLHKAGKQIADNRHAAYDSTHARFEAQQGCRRGCQYNRSKRPAESL